MQYYHVIQEVYRQKLQGNTAFNKSMVTSAEPDAFNFFITRSHFYHMKPILANQCSVFSTFKGFSHDFIYEGIILTLMHRNAFCMGRPENTTLLRFAHSGDLFLSIV